MNKPAVHHITEKLGPDAIRAALGVSHHSIRYARTLGVFPASWYERISAMCKKSSIECPLSAFNWKTTNKNIGTGSANCKGRATQ